MGNSDGVSIGFRNKRLERVLEEIKEKIRPSQDNKYSTYHGLAHTIMKRCISPCADPLCKELGCLNVQAWRFRELIMTGQRYKNEQDRRMVKNPEASDNDVLDGGES